MVRYVCFIVVMGGGGVGYGGDGKSLDIDIRCSRERMES